MNDEVTAGASVACDAVRESAGGTNVLVLAPAFTDGEAALCSCLLSGAPTDATDLLWVTYSDDARGRLTAWNARHDELPVNVGIVEVGSRGAADADVGFPDGVEVGQVSQPDDLTAAGVRLSELLDGWAATGNQSVACFHGLTLLFQYVELDRLYRFLHIVVQRMESADAVAHYHLDPDALDEQALGTVLSLFDAVVEYVDGEWRYRGH